MERETERGEGFGGGESPTQPWTQDSPKNHSCDPSQPEPDPTSREDFESLIIYRETDGVWDRL